MKTTHGSFMLMRTDSRLQKIHLVSSSMRYLKASMHHLRHSAVWRYPSLVVGTIAVVLALTTTCAANEILFDNGSYSDNQSGRYNSIVANIPRYQFRMFDDFVLDHPVIVTGFSWKQHDYFDTWYDSIEITVYGGIPSVSTLLHSETVVASGGANNTPFLAWGFTGKDYTVEGLFLKLDPGHYWLGLNSNTFASYAYGVTSWDSSVGDYPALRGRYQTSPNNPGILPGDFHAGEDSVFQVVGYVVPESSTFVLAASLILPWMMAGWRRNRCEKVGFNLLTWLPIYAR